MRIRLTLAIALTLLTRLAIAESNNPGIGLEGQIIVTPVICPGHDTTATAKLSWPPTVTNRPSGTFTWKLVPTDLAALTAPPGGTSTGNDTSQAALSATTVRSTATRTFQVQVSWKGPPNYNMPTKTATVTIKRDFEVAFGNGKFLDWKHEYDIVELIPIKGGFAEFVKAMLKGAVTATPTFRSGYHSAVRLACPGTELISGSDFSDLSTIENASANKVKDNTMFKLVLPMLETASSATTNGINPLENPGGALEGLKSVANQLGAAAIKAITEQSSAGVSVPLRNPPRRGDVKDEYDDMLALATRLYLAEAATLPVWALDDPKISVTFTATEPKWTTNFVSYLKEKLLGGLPPPIRKIIELFLKSHQLE